MGNKVLALMALAAATACGCASNGDAPAAQSPAPGGAVVPAAAGQPVMNLAQHVDADPGRDAAPAQRFFYHVDIYQITIPFGTISGNLNFWKRIDEQCVDVATYDLLYKNGIRVGEARMEEFDHFKKFVDVPSNCHFTSVSGYDAHGMELEQRKDLIEQTIMHYDGQNQLWGRSFNRCTNVLDVSFESTPRKPGSLRIELCPVVRTVRKRMEFTVLNNERELQFVAPEMLYDLNLRADIPPTSFLIVAPSPDARRQTSVGRAFFTQDGATSLMEQILLIVPHAYVVDEKGEIIIPVTQPAR